MDLQNLTVLFLLVGTTYGWHTFKWDCVDWWGTHTHNEPLTNEIWKDQKFPLHYNDDDWLDVRCEREGWMVIQKRTDASINYNRTLEEYADGFGSVDGDHWLGLEGVHQLTTPGDWTLRIELESFDNEVVWAEYTGFSVGAGPGFILNFDKSSYNGTAGDSLDRSDYNTHGTLHRGMKFTTFDHDQDKDMAYNCAERYGGGGWWYNDCLYATTTGMPYENGMENSVGISKSIYWHMWKGHDRLKAVTMKIRRN